MSIIASIAGAIGGAASSAGSAMSSMGGQMAGYASQAMNSVGDATGINSEEDIAAREAKEALEKSLAEVEAQMSELNNEIATYADADFDNDPDAVGRLSDAEGAYAELEKKKADLQGELKGKETSGSTAVKAGTARQVASAPIGMSSSQSSAGNTSGADIFGAGIPMASLSGTLSGTKPSQIQVLKQQGQAFGGFRI